jgi:hypothetical protein
MVCFELDNFIRDKDKTYWTALLSDGRWIYQDDDRPGEDEPRAWVRLQQFCNDNDLYVKQMRITFRTHTETMPESEEGYFCRNRVLGSLADGVSKTYYFYSLGPIKDSKIYVDVWMIPEVIKEGTTDIRDIEGNEDSIIWNKKSNSYLKTLEKSAKLPTT